MPTQPEEEPAQRLFVAVRPPPPVTTLLLGLPRPSTPGVRWVEPGQWHMTVRFLPSAVPTQVVSTLDRADLTQAAVTLGPAVTSFGDRVVVIPASGLDALASTILDATRDIGPIDPRPFNGHLTLARTKNGVACPLVGRRFIAEFTAVAIELVASDNDGAGSRHRTLATWPLSRPELEQP